jgi:hypothetical protein
MPCISPPSRLLNLSTTVRWNLIQSAAAEAEDADEGSSSFLGAGGHRRSFFEASLQVFEEVAVVQMQARNATGTSVRLGGTGRLRAPDPDALTESIGREAAVSNYPARHVPQTVSRPNAIGISCALRAARAKGIAGLRPSTITQALVP